jgi:hypothetical protein
MRKISLLVILVLFGANSFAQIVTETFATSGTFTVTAGITSITIEAVGAGGNGASNGGGGGGGGGYASGVYSVMPGSVLQVMVAAGGSNSFTGITSLGISAGAGGNATTVPNPTLGGGGAGGVGSGGNIANRSGGAGGGGYWTYFGGGGGGAGGDLTDGGNGFNTIVFNGSNCLTPGGAGGVGGGGIPGNGGKGAGFEDNNCTQSDFAENGFNYGAGGGGGNGIGSPYGIGSSGYISISYGTVGIPNYLSALSIQLTGNPVLNFIGIKNVNGNEDYLVLNAVGQTIWSGKGIQNEDFSFLSKGIYFLQVADGKKSIVLKFIKE